MTYPIEFRIAVADDYDVTGSSIETAETFHCSESWVRRLIQRRRETGSLEPKPARLPNNSKLDERDLDGLAALIARRPDMTLAELAAALDGKVSVPTVWRATQALGLPLKKDPPRRRAGPSRRRRGAAVLVRAPRGRAARPARVPRRVRRHDQHDAHARARPARRARGRQGPARALEGDQHHRRDDGAGDAHLRLVRRRHRHRHVRRLRPRGPRAAPRARAGPGAGQPAGAPLAARGRGRRVGRGTRDAAAAVLAGLQPDRDGVLKGQGAAPQARETGRRRAVRRDRRRDVIDHARRRQELRPTLRICCYERMKTALAPGHDRGFFIAPGHDRGRNGKCTNQPDARFASSAAGVGVRTLRAKPIKASARMTSQLESNCHQRSPCRALVGNAWWLLCQPSPSANTAQTQLFTLWSEVWNSREPQTWQTLLMLHVTCCIKQMRTSPPQTAPLTKPCHEPSHRPTSAPGRRTPRKTQKK